MASSSIFSLPFAKSARRLRMEVITAVAAWAIASSCANIPRAENWLGSLCPRDDATAKLGLKLSAGAQILYPGTEGFLDATKRWSVFSAPEVTMVIVPTTQQDVAEAVKYANKEGKPFMAVNGGHGAITTVGEMKNGIQIWMDKLNTVTVSKDGKTAKIGGGTLSKAVTDTLWAAGKQTVTGGCECTSIMGPGLGGGHGFLQGRYGLVADQFVSMDMVMHDGKCKTITEKDDLWWAMKGAGHNFGIVTSVTSKIYDIKHRDWAYRNFIYTGDKVEALYENINKHLGQDGNQPVDIVNYSFFFNFAAIDPNNSVIMFYILQEGVKEVDPKYTQPFIDLGPIDTKAETGDYTKLPAWTGNANDSPPCQKTGLVNTRFPIDIETYDIPSQRKVYDLFSKSTHETPEFINSLFLFEGYSTQGVKAVAKDTTAFPFRDDNLLIAPLIIYAPGAPELDQKARDLGEGLRNILHEGSSRKEMHTYVNYAFGKEDKKSWYGFEDWRQTKLTALKKKYDPKKKFSFYAPI